MVAAAAAAVRHELIGLGGVVERNWYLVKRYVWWEVAFFLWTCANTLTIVFISKGVGASPAEQNELAATLLIGGVIWRTSESSSDPRRTVSSERWEGTMSTRSSRRSRGRHLFGMGLFAVTYVWCREPALRRDRIVLLAAPSRRELRGGAPVAHDRVGLVHRNRIITAILPSSPPRKGRSSVSSPRG